MEITEQKINNLMVIGIGGRLDATNSEQLQTKLVKIIENDRELLVDFENLDYISSSGLRVLLFILKKIKAANGSMSLCSLNESIKEIFAISGFSNFFKIYNSQDDGVKNLSK